MITQIKSTVLYTKEAEPEADVRRQKLVRRRIIDNILNVAANQILREQLKFQTTEKDMSSTLFLLHENDVTYIVDVFTRLILGKSFVMKPSERENIIKIFNIKPSEQ
jgi:hypothetical protein